MSAVTMVVIGWSSVSIPASLAVRRLLRRVSGDYPLAQMVPARLPTA